MQDLGGSLLILISNVSDPIRLYGSVVTGILLASLQIQHIHNFLSR